jgi:hypothetical protein
VVPGSGMAGGEDAGKDQAEGEVVADGAAEVPGEAKFDPVGEDRAFRMGFEQVMVAPEAERTAHAGIDEEAGRDDGFPAAGPAQGERALADGDGELGAGAGGMVGVDGEDADSGWCDGPEVVRIFVETEEGLGRGGDERGAGEDGHGEVSSGVGKACG